MSRSTDLSRISPAPFAKVAARHASDICARVELSAEATAGLLPTLSPQGFLAVLMNGALFSDAVRFLSFGLPAREGVWWACVVAGSKPLAPAETACLERAETWVYQGDEATRRHCHEDAKALGFKGAAAYASLAAFWSGSSLAPEGAPDVPPHPDLVHIGVSASLLLAVAAADPVLASDTFQEVLTRGMDIARGGNGRLSGDRPRARSAVVGAAT